MVGFGARLALALSAPKHGLELELWQKRLVEGEAVVTLMVDVLVHPARPFCHNALGVLVALLPLFT